MKWPSSLATAATVPRLSLAVKKLEPLDLLALAVIVPFAGMGYFVGVLLALWTGVSFLWPTGCAVGLYGGLRLVRAIAEQSADRL